MKKQLQLSYFMVLILIGSVFIKHAHTSHELIVTVEEMAGEVSFYNPETGHRDGEIKVGYLPHEIVLSKDQKTAYVSNFGLHDYDNKLGIPGKSISVIDVHHHREKFRLYTFDQAKTGHSAIDKAPHGVKLRPPLENQLYTNVEKGHKILIFDLRTKQIVKKLKVDPQTHNFIFSPDGKVLWLIAGPGGIIRMNPDTGKVTGKLKLSSPVRSLSYTPDQQKMMASGANQIVLFEPDSLKIDKNFNNLGVGQLLYSDMTPDQKYILSPAVWNNQVIMVDANNGKVVKRFAAGANPVTVKVNSSGNTAYFTNASDDFITAINLNTFETKKIETAKGPNGLALINT